MIDLHSHILPALDDGAPDLSVSLAMAEAFVDGGVNIVACTPHILPGLYHNTGPGIRAAVAELQAEIDRSGIPLRLTTGADVHIAPGLASALRSGQALTLADSRYVLIEPPHHVMPARFEETLFDLMVAGFVPILTHPERLSWIKGHYPLMQRLTDHGVWMQITAGSLTGKFGKSALYWAERMLDEGLVQILASDAHDVTRRGPNLAEGAEAALRRVGEAEAWELVVGRPQAILSNAAREDVSRPQPRDGRSSPIGTVGLGLRTGVGDGNKSGSADMSGTYRGIGRRLRRIFQ